MLTTKSIWIYTYDLILSLYTLRIALFLHSYLSTFCLRGIKSNSDYQLSFYEIYYFGRNNVKLYMDYYPTWYEIKMFETSMFN